MELTATDLWERVLDAARPGMPEQSFKTWLSGTRAVALSESELHVAAPSEFHVEWIEDKFQPVLEELVERALGRHLTLVFSIGEGVQPAFPSVEVTPPAAPGDGDDRSPAPATPSPVPNRGPSPAPGPRHQPALNDRYTFERFVVGSNNQLASAACHAVAEKPARMYNPLFLYGGVGLGKTHLMHAIGNHILERDPTKRVLYVSSEQFTNELVTAIMEGTTTEFRRRYRRMDLLLVDDVHFIQRKDRTQEEFFHTFNALYDAQKQIILTSDRPPKEMSELEERLVSRFEWGLVADIKPPDYETRVAILRKKAADDHLTLDDDVIDFIAQSCSASVRELEGAVIKLLAYSSLTNQEVNVDLARTALSGMIRGDDDDAGDPAGELTPEGIRAVVARRWEVKPEQLASKRRTKNLTVPRQVAMFLIKEILDTPLVAIGEVFGGRDHSTVIHSLKKVEERMDDDGDFAARVDDARRELLGGPA
jgi:chromosomal replication initiator protein